MDPITHASLGAAVALSFLGSRKIRIVALVGLLAGIAPDADIFIRSDTNTLLALEYHRHFTHSLTFIPVGALLVAGLAWLFLRKHASFLFILAAAFFGYASHGLNDSATNYGTLLLWPFSDARISWNIISVVDPFYTLPLLLGVALSVFKNRPGAARAALIYSFAYLAFGIFQKSEALKTQEAIASERGHIIERGLVHPTIGNMVLWRSTYEYEDRLYADAIHAAPFLPSIIWTGDSVQKAVPKKILPPKLHDSTLFRDLKRYQWFSDGFIFFHPQRNNVIGDFRFSLLPNSILPLWGITYDPDNPQTHAKTVDFTEARQEAFKYFYEFLTRERPSAIKVPSL